MKQEKTNLKGFTLAELQDFVESLGEKKYRAANRHLAIRSLIQYIL